MARKSYSEEVVASKAEEIIDAAMVVLESGEGLEAVSFRKVATVMKCSYSAPYRHISGNDELLTALRARAFRWIEQETSKAISAAASPSENLEAVAHAYIKAGTTRPDLYQLMYFQIKDLDFGERTIELNAAKHDSLNVCTQVIIESQLTGDFSAKIDPLTASHFVWVAAHGLVSLHISNQFVMGKSIEDLVPILIRSTALSLGSIGDDNSN